MSGTARRHVSVQGFAVTEQSKNSLFLVETMYSIKVKPAARPNPAASGRGIGRAATMVFF
jgi:ribosomal protein S18 acetylase RimI-like enzyme